MQTKAKTGFFSRFIGDKAFYKLILGVTVPIMIQNGISNFVSMLDNIMVGQIGTEQMSGVSIVNQLVFIYFLAIFGGMGGIGIFTAQYYGSNDQEGVRATFRAKFVLGLVLTAIAFVVLSVFGKELIGLYLNDSGDGSDLAATLQYAESYLWIIFISFPAFFVLQVYASTLRACGETVLPMKAGIAAVLTNLLFNWLLIYGVWFFPKLGVQGGDRDGAGPLRGNVHRRDLLSHAQRETQLHRRRLPDAEDHQRPAEALYAEGDAVTCQRGFVVCWNVVPAAVLFGPRPCRHCGV